MTFEQALQAMREGKIVTRPCFVSEVLRMNDKELQWLRKVKGEYINCDFYATANVDLIAEDWEIVDE